MNILKFILIGIVAIIALILIVALFVDNKYTVARDITINKPVVEVFDYVKYLKKQDNFNKWTMTDPNMKREYRGVDGTVGFVYAWNGNDKAGEGEQEIKEIREGRELVTEIRFVRPFKSVAHITLKTDEVSLDQTKVTWIMQGESKYPLNIMTLLMRGMLGKDMDESLTTLKGIMEK